MINRSLARIGLALTLTACIAFGVVPLAQAAWPQLGISQSFRNFGLKVDEGPYDVTKDVSSSEFWAPLQISRLRVIIPFDLASRSPSDGRRQEFQHWLDRANELGAEPYVVFGPTELTENVVDPEVYPNEVFRTPANDPNAPNELVAPLVATYRTAIGEFMDTWGPGTEGDVRLFGAWNEPNVKEVGQHALPGGAGNAKVYLPASSSGGYSTSHTLDQGEDLGLSNCSGSTQNWTVYNCGPRMAAYYWHSAVQEIVERAAKCNEGSVGCKVVAGEFAARVNHLWYWDKYASQLQAISGLTPATISFHGHNDADPLTGSSADCKNGGASGKCVTKTFYEWLSGEPYPWNDRSVMKIWDTEVGARHDAGTSSSTDDIAQRNRFDHLIELSENYDVTRLYYFNFQGSGTDRGLIEPGETVNTTARPIWDRINCRPQTPC